jgi:hypothetical protein
MERDHLEEALMEPDELDLDFEYEVLDRLDIQEMNADEELDEALIDLDKLRNVMRGPI